MPSSTRQTFTTSRLLDFFTTRELAKQVGHDDSDWPLVVLKELTDNALDGCEEAGVAPDITVAITDDAITVTDNGPGVDADTIAKILDYTTRTSSREAYVEPTRGAQGNALKTLIATPFVLDGEEGDVTITTRGTRHEITVRVDHVKGEPVIDHEQHDAPKATGTIVKIHWPETDKASVILQEAHPRFLQNAENVAWLNPHARITIRDGIGENERVYEPTDAGWQKWSPSTPPVPHWYAEDDIERLIAACVTADRERGDTRTVRALASMFKGLASTAKQKKATSA